MQTDLTILVAHDYKCPWCWFGLFQVKRLRQDFPKLTFDWRGYECQVDPRHRPAPCDRLRELVATDQIRMPSRWPSVVNTHLALEGAEFFKETNPTLFDAYNEAVYRAFWDRSEDISKLEVLKGIVGDLGVDLAAFQEAVTSRIYRERIVPLSTRIPIDGITHLTTFCFRGEQCAEAPYSTVHDLAYRFVAWYG